MREPQIEERDLFEDLLDHHFLSQRKIFLFGDIEEDTARKTVKQLMFLADKGPNDISLYIHSDGGSIDAQYAIIDTIHHLQTKICVATIAIGKCCSAAANILTCGTIGLRCATENTAIMFHPISFESSNDYVSKQVKYTEFANRQNDILYGLVAKNCKKKKESFAKLIEDGLWMTAKEALKFGAIDLIL